MPSPRYVEPELLCVEGQFGGMEVSDARRLRALEEENARLKRLLADTMLDNAVYKGPAFKKMATPAAKREAVAHLQTTLGMSERRVCAVVGADRPSGSPEHAISLVPSRLWRPGVAVA